MIRITDVYRCFKEGGCGHEWDIVQPKADRAEALPCPECGHEAPRVPGAPRVFTVAIRDGTGRFDGIRETQRLRRIAQEARVDGRKDDYKKAKAEQRKAAEKVK